MKKLFFFLAALCFAGASMAQAKTYEPYFVSGVIKLNGSEATVKVVQGMLISDSPENARLVFTGLAIKQFPGFTPVDSIAVTFSHLFKTLPGSSTTEEQKKPQLLSNI